MPFKELFDRAKALLAGRKPMGSARKKHKKGPAGEQRNYRVDERSPIGKAQARNRKVKNMLDQLD